MTCRIQTYIVRTMHEGEFKNTFIVPVEIEAYSAEDAAQKRFDLLSKREKARTRALLVQLKLYGSPQLFEVKSKTVPTYTVTAA